MSSWHWGLAGHLTATMSPFQHLDQSLLTLNKLISEDERIGSNPVARMVLADPTAFLPQLPQDSGLQCSRMWQCRKRLNAEHLRHVVEQRSGRESVPALWHFLQHVRPLHSPSEMPLHPHIRDPLQRNPIRSLQ